MLQPWDFTPGILRAGLLAIGATNAVPTVAPVGGKTPIIGTNPISYAVPAPNGGIAFLVDQSATQVAWTAVKRAAEEQDKDLGGKLTKELPGILNWAIQGCLNWQEQGLNPPQIVHDQVSAYKTEMDSIAQFVEQECILEPETKYPASKLYEAYRHYC